MNMFIGKIPFQIVYGRLIRRVVKLPNLEDKRSDDASEFVENM